MEFGIWSLTPAVVAIGLAIATRQVLLSLFIGIWVGGAMIYGGNVAAGFTQTLAWMVDNVTDSWNATILVFTFTIGGLIGLWVLSGGTRGFADLIAKRVRSARGSQLGTYLGGWVVFLDDYANCVTVGTTFSALSDKFRVSKEKLSFIVDSTAAPVATLFLISSWIGFEIGLIGDSLPEAATMTPYMYFLSSIPYKFYSLMLLALVFIVILWRRDYGPMLAAEHRARTTGKLIRDGGQPLSGGVEFDVVERDTYRSHNMWVSLVVLIGMTVFGMWWTGGGPEGASFFDAIADADAATALLWAAMTAIVVSLGMNLGQRLGGITRNMDAVMRGVTMMVFAVTILVLAWSVKSSLDALGAAPYLVGVLEGIISPLWLPIGIFVLAALVSFFTGTSWGTMGIIMPLAIPLAFGIGADVVIVISAVLTGAIFGDHSSPISDTTILASTFTGADHIDHVRTQLPYALTAAILAAILYILVGVGIPVVVVLAIGAAVLVAVVYILSKLWSRMTGIPQPITEVGVE